MIRLKDEFIPKLLPLTDNNLHNTVKENLLRLQSSLAKLCITEVSRSHTVPIRKKEVQILRLYDPDLEEK